MARNLWHPSIFLEVFDLRLGLCKLCMGILAPFTCCGAVDKHVNSNEFGVVLKCCSSVDVIAFMAQGTQSEGGTV